MRVHHSALPVLLVLATLGTFPRAARADGEAAQAAVAHIEKALGPFGDADDQSVTRDYVDARDLLGWGVYGRFALVTTGYAFAHDGGPVDPVSVAPSTGWMLGVKLGNPYTYHVDASFLLRLGTAGIGAGSKDVTGQAVPQGAQLAFSGGDVWMSADFPAIVLWDLPRHTPVPHLAVYFGFGAFASFGAPAVKRVSSGTAANLPLPDSMIAPGIRAGLQATFFNDGARASVTVMPTYLETFDLTLQGEVEVRPFDFVSRDRHLVDLVIEAGFRTYGTGTYDKYQHLTTSMSSTVISAGVYLTFWADPPW